MATARESNPTMVTGTPRVPSAMARARSASIAAASSPTPVSMLRPARARSMIGQRLVGVEEEVAAHLHSGQAVVAHAQVDGDQLAAGHLVLTMEPLAHGGQARRQPPPPPAAANGGVLTNSDERADTEHLP